MREPTFSNEIGRINKQMDSLETKLVSAKDLTDLISRQDALALWDKYHCSIAIHAMEYDEELRSLPSVQPTLRERALMLLLNWAVECDFGYDNFPEEYERYKGEIEDMSYFDGMIYIAEKEVERNGCNQQTGSD